MAGFIFLQAASVSAVPPLGPVLLGEAGGRELWDLTPLLPYFEEPGVEEQSQTMTPRRPESVSVHQSQLGCESPLSNSRESQAFITGSLSAFCSNVSVPNLFSSGGRISSERG